jgi:hypothetical protein
MTVLPEEIHRISTIQLKIPVTFFIDIEKHNHKINMETQKILNSQSNPEQKEQF